MTHQLISSFGEREMFYMFQYEELNKQFIGGRWRDGSSRNVLENRNPYTQKVITSFQKATSDDVDAAYRAAALAKQEWDKVNPFKKRPFWKKPFLSLKSTKKRLFT